MQGNTIELNLRFDDTVRTLKSRGNDREAREVLLQLAKDFKTLNDELMSQFTRLSAINRTIVEMLQKSKDGKAALMMRKAAELLVKVRYVFWLTSVGWAQHTVTWYSECIYVCVHEAYHKL